MTTADRQSEARKQIGHRAAWFFFGVALSNFVTCIIWMVNT